MRCFALRSEECADRAPVDPRFRGGPGTACRAEDYPRATAAAIAGSPEAAARHRGLRINDLDDPERGWVALVFPDGSVRLNARVARETWFRPGEVRLGEPGST